MWLAMALLTASCNASGTEPYRGKSYKTYMHPGEGYYHFPGVLGKQQTTLSGRCKAGDRYYEDCLVKVFSHGFTLHAGSESPISGVPIFEFRSDSVIIPELYTETSGTVLEALSEQPANRNDHVHIKALTIRDIYLPASPAVFDHLTTGPLRVAVSVKHGEFEIDEADFCRLAQL